MNSRADNLFLESINKRHGLSNKKHRSLEQRLIVFYTIVGGLMAGLLAALLDAYQVSWLSAVSLFVLITPIFLIGVYRHFQATIQPLYQLTTLIEAIARQDYSLCLSSKITEGVVAQLFQESNRLVQRFQIQQDQRHQHVLLVYQLIEVLDAPIALFDQRGHLQHANPAFSDFLSQPWQHRKGHTLDELGFVVSPELTWGFRDNTQAKHWQIRHSQFQEPVNGQTETHHLVVLMDIEQAIKATQQNVWHQVIRVMNHEIRNSMTPIHSLSQSLIEAADMGQESFSPVAQQALETIAQRCQSLQNFVTRYRQNFRADDFTPKAPDASTQHWIQQASLESVCSDQQPLPPLNRRATSIKPLLNKLVSLFPNIPFRVQTPDLECLADPILLEQVGINLIKNSIEANASSIEIQVVCKGHTLVIFIRDDGSGISNPDNLFVPLYTTKKNGQGIGLVFCQKIIEHHGGKLELRNRLNQSGAEAVIVLTNSLQ